MTSSVWTRYLQQVGSAEFCQHDSTRPRTVHTVEYPWDHLQTQAYITYINTYTHTPTHTYIHPHMHTYIHPYTHTPTHAYIHTYKFIMRLTCQFASKSGALQWYQKQLRVARLKPFSFKPVLKSQKLISWTGVDTKRVPDCRSGCTKRSRCKWYNGWLLLKEESWSWAHWHTSTSYL